MRARRSPPRVAASLTLLALAACADPTSAPVSAPAEPASPALSLAQPEPRVALLASNLNGGVFHETFDLYKPLPTPQDTNWRAGPVLWLPNDSRGPTIAQPQVMFPDWVSPTYDRSLLGDWSVVKHSRDEAFWDRIEGPFMAWHHGTNCDAPPIEHPIASYDESVFLCRNHMMTTVNATGYGVTYLTPNRMVDFTSGVATIRFDVATKRETKNDWIDLWVTPYDYNLVTPLDESLEGTDLQGEPKYGLHIRMTADDRNVSSFKAFLIINHIGFPIPNASTAGYETRFPQSATVRQRFELQLSRTRLKFGLPGPVLADGTTGAPLWWIDTPIIPWSGIGGPYRAVVQIGHHSLNPGADGGKPTTWHWDNVAITPAVPFTIINATTRYATAGSPSVTLKSPAPSGARLRFAAHGRNMEVSFDGGRRWTDARRQDQELNLSTRFNSYWMSIPAGTQTIRFRGSAANGFSKWFVRDVSVWAGGETRND
jgi:hypothetical protein